MPSIQPQPLCKHLYRANEYCPACKEEEQDMELVTKASKVMEALNADPNRMDQEIAKEVGCSAAYVGQLRKKMVHAKPQDLCTHGNPDTPEDQCEQCWHDAADEMFQRVGGEIDFNDAPTQEELDVVLEAASILNPTSLDAVLNERGSRYGSFLKHAVITQRLKAVMSDTPNWIALNDDMVEALEMIAHKIGRILNGDPSYADSWVDIAGYAQLVADRLQGKER